MPLVRISMKQGRTPEQRKAIADGVYEAMLETINVPQNDRFQLILERNDSELIADSDYLGIHRTNGVVFIEVTLRKGRTVEMKQAFYRRVAEKLSENPGVRKEDILIVLHENDFADWSFGNGEAQYVK